MLANTIQYFVEMAGFNQFSIEFWHTVVSANGIKYDV